MRLLPCSPSAPLCPSRRRRIAASAARRPFQHGAAQLDESRDGGAVTRQHPERGEPSALLREPATSEPMSRLGIRHATVRDVEEQLPRLVGEPRGRYVSTRATLAWAIR